MMRRLAAEEDEQLKVYKWVFFPLSQSINVDDTRAKLRGFEDESFFRKAKVNKTINLSI
jgi:hypothetical protein